MLTLSYTMTEIIDRIHIAAHFNGPPGSGNGGYVSGLMAKYVSGPVSVRLVHPPPLDTMLDVIKEGDVIKLLSGDTMIASAKSDHLDLDVPDPPGIAAAIECSKAYPGFEQHAFPHCFVCGPKRNLHQGLRIFPGSCNHIRLVAAPFYPYPDLCTASGHLATEFIWASLDCPGAFAITEAVGWKKLVLGTITAEILNEVNGLYPLQVIGWYIDHERRKYRCGTAIFDGEGQCMAKARATWIDIP